MRWFHGAAARTLVATPSMRGSSKRAASATLRPGAAASTRELFRPRDKAFLLCRGRSGSTSGGWRWRRASRTSSKLDLPGTKLVVGDGPATGDLRRRFRMPCSRATARRGPCLHVAAADVFVFPSRTDTFGLVLLEAMACGVPVAAYPVTGPIDVVADGVTGVLDEDLRVAALAALTIDPEACREHALEHSWEAARGSSWPAS